MSRHRVHRWSATILECSLARPPLQRFTLLRVSPSFETAIRLPSFALVATLASLALPGSASGQASRGAISVGATILPAPPGAWASRLSVSVDAEGNRLLRIANGTTRAAHSPTFIRISRDDGQVRRRIFRGHPANGDTGTLLRLPHVGNDVTLRIERLIVAGT